MSEKMCGVCHHVVPGHEPGCPVETGLPQQGIRIAEVSYVHGQQVQGLAGGYGLSGPGTSKQELRKNELLLLAAQYIREHSTMDDLIHYDGTECDGACLADDCEAAARYDDVTVHDHRDEQDPARDEGL